MFVLFSPLIYSLLSLKFNHGETTETKHQKGLSWSVDQKYATIRAGSFASSRLLLAMTRWIFTGKVL